MLLHFELGALEEQVIDLLPPDVEADLQPLLGVKRFLVQRGLVQEPHVLKEALHACMVVPDDRGLVNGLSVQLRKSLVEGFASEATKHLPQSHKPSQVLQSNSVTALPSFALRPLPRTLSAKPVASVRRHCALASPRPIPAPLEHSRHGSRHCHCGCDACDHPPMVVKHALPTVQCKVWPLLWNFGLFQGNFPDQTFPNLEMHFDAHHTRSQRARARASLGIEQKSVFHCSKTAASRGAPKRGAGGS